MKQADWTDGRGRKYRVILPDEANETEAPMGIPLGPPDAVDFLELPEPFATRLHNTLHERGLYRARDIRKNPQAIFGALQSALKVDVHLLMQAYAEAEMEVPFEQQNGRGP